MTSQQNIVFKLAAEEEKFHDSSAIFHIICFIVDITHLRDHTTLHDSNISFHNLDLLEECHQRFKNRQSCKVCIDTITSINYDFGWCFTDVPRRMDTTTKYVFSPPATNCIIWSIFGSYQILNLLGLASGPATMSIKTKI